MNAELELARAVFPDRKWVHFDPLGTHFADVLAWLLRQDIVNHVDSDSVVTGIGKRVSVTFSDPHDNTAASIKQAVYEAAIRVIKEGKV